MIVNRNVFLIFYTCRDPFKKGYFMVVHKMIEKDVDDELARIHVKLYLMEFLVFKRKNE